MLKAAAIKVTGWSNNFCCVFHCDRCFYLWFCNRTFKETVGKLLEAKIMSQYWAAQTVAGNPNIVQCVCATGRAGLSNAKKKKKNSPQMNSEVLNLLFMGFIASAILWQCFQCWGPPKFTMKMTFLIKFQNWDIIPGYSISSSASKKQRV